MNNCMICERIEWIKAGKNPYFVRELNTGYVVIGDHQRIKGYTLRPDKLNYELLGAGTGRHMHWHIFPRRTGDTPAGGPVWSLGAELFEEKYLPGKEELEDLKTQLNRELDKLLMQ